MLFNATVNMSRIAGASYTQRKILNMQLVQWNKHNCDIIIYKAVSKVVKEQERVILPVAANKTMNISCSNTW